MAKFYFTFGTDPLFPHSEKEFVEVEAGNRNEAGHKFSSVYPSRARSNLLNCAFVYREKEFNEIRNKYYSGRKPARTIN